jgi:hypothetical protein
MNQQFSPSIPIPTKYFTVSVLSKSCLLSADKQQASGFEHLLGKLNKHNFKGIFLGYTASDQNIVYLDLGLGLVKQSHHAQIDKAWFLQDSCPPAAQLLYNLGMELDGNRYSETELIAPDIKSDYRLPGTIKPIQIPWPPISPHALLKPKLTIPDECTYLPLPLRHIHSCPH